jgi:hypothetical protein
MKYKVLRPVISKKKLYAIGSTVDMNDSPLHVALGYLEVIGESEPAAEPNFEAEPEPEVKAKVKRGGKE